LTGRSNSDGRAVPRDEQIDAVVRLQGGIANRPA
jgi:hypothetical protein